MDMIKFPSPFGDKLQLMNDIMDDQKVECVDVDGNDTVKLWKFYTEDERKAMENGMWYLLADIEIADVLCVVI